MLEPCLFPLPGLITGTGHHDAARISYIEAIVVIPCRPVKAWSLVSTTCRRPGVVSTSRGGPVVSTTARTEYLHVVWYLGVEFSP